MPPITIPGRRKASLASLKTFHLPYRFIQLSAKRLFMSDGCSWFVDQMPSMVLCWKASWDLVATSSNHRAYSRAARK
jgi:hypothetical protein